MIVWPPGHMFDCSVDTPERVSISLYTIHQIDLSKTGLAFPARLAVSSIPFLDTLSGYFFNVLSEFDT